MMDGCLVSGPRSQNWPPRLHTAPSVNLILSQSLPAIIVDMLPLEMPQLGNARESLANNKNHDENFFATIVQVRCDLHVTYWSTTLHPSADDTTIVKLCFSWPTGSGVISGGSRRSG